MTDIISSAGIIFNGTVGMIGDVAETVVDTPLVLLFVLVPVAFLGINMFRKLLNL